MGSPGTESTTAPSQEALEDCDTLIIVGSSFPYLEFYPKPGKAKCVQIDADPARIGLRHPVDVGLVGDSRRVLEGLLPLIPRKPDRGFLEKAQADMKQWEQLMEERGTRPDKPMKPQVVAYQVNKLLRDDAIVVDANEPPMPGNVTTKQAWNFAKALVRGEKDRFEIIKTVLEDKIREVV